MFFLLHALRVQTLFCLASASALRRAKPHSMVQIDFRRSAAFQILKRSAVLNLVGKIDDLLQACHQAATRCVIKNSTSTSTSRIPKTCGHNRSRPDRARHQFGSLINPAFLAYFRCCFIGRHLAQSWIHPAIAACSIDTPWICIK